MTALQRPLTQRVRLGAYYTNGEYLAEVVEVHPLGSVSLACCERDLPPVTVGIDAFRRRWWLVREASA